MTFAELDIAPRTRGRGRTPMVLQGVGELSLADLALLNAERGTKPIPLKEIRDRHHNVARLLAQGMRPAEVSVITGMSLSRISILQSDPTFAKLMEDYRSLKDGALAEFSDRANTLSVSVVAALQDQVEAHMDGEAPLSPSVLLEIGKFAADRTGNAPTSKTLNVNMNVGLGTRMTEARERMRQLRIVSSERVEGEEVASDDG